jgi:nucleotide-binding universal stress UspA family protein
VVAGVDGAQGCLYAVAVAAAWARRHDRPLEVVHAWQVPDQWATTDEQYTSDVDKLEEIHREVVDLAVAFARNLDADPTGRLERGTPSEVLRRIGASSALLVVASHRARSLVGFLLGSVTHELLVEPPAPVIVVSPPI